MEEKFLAEQWKRFCNPWKNPAFKYYLFWIVFCFGSLGIGISIAQEYKNVEGFEIKKISESIATTFVALIAGSLVDLNLSFNIKNIPSLIINSIAFIGVSILLVYLSFSINGLWSLIPAVIGYLLSLVIWILANSDNEKLSDSTYYKRMIDKSNSLTKDWDNNGN